MWSDIHLTMVGQDIFLNIFPGQDIFLNIFPEHDKVVHPD
jgi:hypothetical protein